MTAAGPGYWMHETTGVLRPVVEAYLNGAPMSIDQIGAMRAYLRQWMNGDWKGDGIQELRVAVDDITDRASLDEWLLMAEQLNIDPL